MQKRVFLHFLLIGKQTRQLSDDQHKPGNLAICSHFRLKRFSSLLSRNFPKSSPQAHVSGCERGRVSIISSSAKPSRCPSNYWLKASEASLSLKCTPRPVIWTACQEESQRHIHAFVRKNVNLLLLSSPPTPPPTHPPPSPSLSISVSVSVSVSSLLLKRALRDRTNVKMAARAGRIIIEPRIIPSSESRPALTRMNRM